MQASYLLSIRGFMTLVTLLILLPIASSFLTRMLHYDPITKDLTIARLAAISGIIGYLLIFIASTTFPLLTGIFFISLAVPFAVSVISVATSFVPSQNQVATLYAAMSVSRSVGSVIAGPIFASLYGVGMQLGLEWSGLPFAVGSMIFFLTLISVVCIRAQTRVPEGSWFWELFMSYDGRKSAGRSTRCSNIQELWGSCFVASWYSVAQRVFTRVRIFLQSWPEKWIVMHGVRFETN